jgi:SAM-dependent methyltransferase
VAQFDHAVRGRLNSWFFRAMDGYMDAKYGALKRRLFAGAPGVVLEIGPGVGANLRYFPRGTRVIAVEPNVRMHDALAHRARSLGIDLDLRGLAGEAIDVPSESVDFAIASLVLCSVTDPQAVVAELHRVLRPGGRFACVEHVAAPATTSLGQLQRFIAKPWKWTFEGCELRRDTAGTLHAAGFSAVDVEHFRLPTIFLPIRPQIAAMCTK